MSLTRAETTLSETPEIWDPIARKYKPNVAAMVRRLNSMDRAMEVDKFAAEDALICEMACYKVKWKTNTSATAIAIADTCVH